jgi:arginine utilization protein RocB
LVELAQLAERVAQPGGAAPFVRAAAIQLVGWPSVTGTSAETEFGERLQMLIRSLPYFRTHPEAVWLEPVPDDPLGRSNLFALVRGGGASGVVLMGHYDVVSTEPYGGLQDLAFRPEELRTALVEELSRSARSAADQLALNDLADAAFLPGRGILDMKSGLAAGLAVLLRCAEAGEGTVLFIASPDEEALSAGARAAVSGLGRVAERTGIEFVAAVNLDSEVDPGDGSRGRAVFLGSVGKLLPAALLVGRPAHSGAPFAGVNAAYLGAALAVDLELSPIWSTPGEAGIAPPVCLSLRDLKSGYDVTLPSMSFVAFNVMFHQRAPAEVFQAFVEQVGIVLRRALRTLADRATAAGAQVSWSEPAVLTLAELPGVGEPGPVTSPDPLLGSWDAAVSAVRRAGVDGPAAVALLAGPYYPSVALGDDRRSARLLEIAALHAERLGAERGAPISLRDCFPGISDMSFLGSGRAGAVHEVVNTNTPDAGRFSWDGFLSARLEVPVVNIGPWGRDYHERLERVHEGYSFETLPELIYSVVRDLLKEN